MQKKSLIRYTLFSMIVCSSPILSDKANCAPIPTNNSQAFSSFTGKITRDKVRLRAEAHLDAPIIRETNRGDLFVVISETPEFYAVLPPKDTKAYIFRTFVLDNIIEGSRVNVRLKPEMEAPVIAQLNTGDRVNGVISPQNNKWFEITPPSTARFYIAKEYIQKIGAPDLLEKLEKRKIEASHLIQTASSSIQSELQKPFEEIRLDTAQNDLKKVIKDYSDLEAQADEAQKLLGAVHETYLQKKLIYLEEQAKRASSLLSASNEKMKVQEPETNQVNKDPKQTSDPSFDSHRDMSSSGSVTAKMSSWIPIEEGLFAEWASQHTENHTMADFYKEQKEHALTLRGVIEPYLRPVKNKPGDYILMNNFNNLPVAYLYSTTINLKDYVGMEVNVIVAPRPNHHFAYPAYFVLGIE